MNPLVAAWLFLVLMVALCLTLTHLHNKRFEKRQKEQIDKDWADFREMSDKNLALEFMRLDEHTPRFRRICHAIAIRFADQTLSKDQVIDSRD